MSESKSDQITKSNQVFQPIVEKMSQEGPRFGITLGFDLMILSYGYTTFLLTNNGVGLKTL